VPTDSVLGAEEKRGQHCLSFLFGEHLAQSACPERLVCTAEFNALPRILDRKNLFFRSVTPQAQFVQQDPSPTE